MCFKSCTCAKLSAILDMCFKSCTNSSGRWCQRKSTASAIAWLVLKWKSNHECLLSISKSTNFKFLIASACLHMCFKSCKLFRKMVSKEMKERASGIIAWIENGNQITMFVKHEQLVLQIFFESFWSYYKGSINFHQFCSWRNCRWSWSSSYVTCSFVWNWVLSSSASR
jgi:hypothetical protein